MYLVKSGACTAASISNQIKNVMLHVQVELSLELFWTLDQLCCDKRTNTGNKWLPTPPMMTPRTRTPSLQYLCLHMPRQKQKLSLPFGFRWRKAMIMTVWIASCLEDLKIEPLRCWEQGNGCQVCTFFVSTKSNQSKWNIGTCWWKVKILAR